MYIGNGFRLNDATKERRRHNRRHMAMNRRALREGLDYIQQPSAFFGLADWRAVGGLDEKLHFCMDWDMLIRIADRGPVVLIDEFLSLSREYEDTKTAAGGLERCAELCRMIRSHTGREMTIGGAIYLTETMLLPRLGGDMGQTYRDGIYRGLLEAQARLATLGALPDGSPDHSDPGDITYLPIPVPVAADTRAPGPTPPGTDWPRITVVTPSFNQARFLERTLRSVIDQGYPNLEMVVMDGGSTDGSVEVVERFAGHLAHWESKPDRGPAHAINEGFARSTGEILVWLNSDDMFAEGALHAIGAAFAADAALDMVYGDALYIDADDRPAIVDHGEYKTSHYFGRMEERDRIPAYWSYVHSVPQPATYVRRRLLERLGNLDESYKFIFDFELFFRLMHQSRIRKIDRVLAFYRIHAAAKTSGWSNFLVELYRFSRRWWPVRGDPAFKATRASFLAAFMERYWGGSPRGLAFRAHRAFFSLVATYDLANPEALLARRDERRQRSSRGVAARAVPTVPALVQGRGTVERPHPLVRGPARFRVVFCGLFLPRFPGMSGGEIRDFHLVRGLLAFCRVSMVVLNDVDRGGEQQDFITAELESFHDPARIAAAMPHLMRPAALAGMASRAWLTMDRVRLGGWPVVGPQLPRDVEIYSRLFEAKLAGAMTAMLAEAPDFLFISPQTNPAALFLDKRRLKTRFIFATYDVESVRLRRLSAKASGLKAIGSRLETRRGAKYEQDYVSRFDGVIAVSELDKRIFVESYGVAPERVAVIDNGVDADYFGFRPRGHDGPPIVMFPASFGYPPNHHAALRLATRIMPLLWQTHPDAQLWLVGQSPAAEILALGDEPRIVVTGRVESVLPYFARASFLCAPLELGSGTKTKVIEAMAAGLPVVCTPLAAEGLHVTDGTHVAVRDDDEGLVGEMVRLFGDPPATAAMTTAARALAEAEYSWDSVLPKLAPWLDALATLPRVQPPCDRPGITPGTRIEACHDALLGLLGTGWSQPEPTHIWSLGPAAELWLKPAPGSRRLCLALSGNPHVPGRSQHLDVLVNDRPVASRTLPADDRTMLELDCASDAWLADRENRITFRLDATASCAADSRDMGLCLWHLAIV